MYKQGDKVKCVKKNHGFEDIGDIYTVHGNFPIGLYLIKSDDPNHVHLGECDCYELVQNVPTSRAMVDVTFEWDVLPVKDYFIANPVSKEKQKCICVFRDLLMNGCKCGGI